MKFSYKKLDEQTARPIIPIELRHKVNRFDMKFLLILGRISAGFMPGLNTNGHGILGQRGFFDLYQVKFSYLKGEILLSEYGQKAKQKKKW